MELRSLDPASRAAIARLRRQHGDALDSILCDGAATGVFAAADTRVAPRALIAMLTGVTTRQRDGGPMDRRAVEDHYALPARRMVGA